MPSRTPGIWGRLAAPRQQRLSQAVSAVSSEPGCPPDAEQNGRAAAVGLESSAASSLLPGSPARKHASADPANWQRAALKE